MNHIHTPAAATEPLLTEATTTVPADDNAADYTTDDLGTGDAAATLVIPEDATATVPPPTDTGTDETADSTDELERVQVEVKQLYAEIKGAEMSARQTKDTLEKRRAALGEMLFELQTLVAEHTHDSLADRLRRLNVPRPTAYRLIKKHQERLRQGTCLTETPTQAPATVAPVDPIEALVAKLLPKIRKVVTAPDASALRLVQTIAQGLGLDVVFDGEQGGFSVYLPEA